MKKIKTVEIFTDGACSGNPGPGGFGVVLRFGNTEKELSGGCSATTNNRMELLGVITGPFTAGAAGITTALLCGLVVSFITGPKDK